MMLNQDQLDCFFKSPGDQLVRDKDQEVTDVQSSD